jgi:hypothetical protein
MEASKVGDSNFVNDVVLNAAENGVNPKPTPV